MVSHQPHLDKTFTLAVVGDVHDRWDADDEAALNHLGVDLVVLVGDFGNESVDVVRAIANLNIPKAAILGNHDAWYTASDWGRKRSPYDHRLEDRVQQQLDLLGAAHIGYGVLDVPELQLSVVGGRPFSWGGSVWKNSDFYQTRYHVSNFEESTAKIVAAARQAAFNTVIFVGHCGPTGLGDRAEDPCGRDWNPIGGDHGDPDLALAIAQTRALGKSIPLVTFGHMHHQLRHSKQHRTMVHSDLGTVYLNAASVPRIIDTAEGRQRNFSLVSLRAGSVTKASLVWLNPQFEISEQTVLYEGDRTAAHLASS
ncbi:TIGR04168 family protein [Oculatella sp. LEGE 06141]|uniref:TIGR04168 family protein n=1 Tax=Oculatella sp. LEGE 06141 TaxID=1828648 RepID=UPI00188106A5|nr:TIGR04168 family protein [Oculatella sp. LEGE 06141]MBE9178974.1 TIGR04168 family protein [Oculatella sp. LEGE 06141]